MTPIKLPNIDYTPYMGTSGMATSVWGTHAWNFLFTCIMGRYPVAYNKNDKEHRQIKQEFESLLTSLDVIMPCIYCRNSFKGFLKELPIKPYLIGRMELMYWLYLMKDKVNKKLITQERKCYNEEKRKLKNLVRKGELSEIDYYTKVENVKKETFKTVMTPPFKEVLDRYEQIRAVCSPLAKTCALPKKKD
jgi:hypothetical protein